MWAVRRYVHNSKQFFSHNRYFLLLPLFAHFFCFYIFSACLSRFFISFLVNFFLSIIALFASLRINDLGQMIHMFASIKHTSTNNSAANFRFFLNFFYFYKQHIRSQSAHFFHLFLWRFVLSSLNPLINCFWFNLVIYRMWIWKFCNQP